MIGAWTKNLKTEEEITRFKNQFKGSRGVFERLQELMDEEKTALESSEISSKIYDSPNWDYKQAHTNGFKAALKMVGTLIKPDKD